MSENTVYDFENKKLVIKEPILGMSLESTLEVKEVTQNSDEGTILACFYEIDREGIKLLHGPSRGYYSDGTLSGESWYFEGKKVGKSQTFFPNGDLCSSAYYANGVLEGKEEYFYEDGTLKTEISHKRGVLDGEVKLYRESGKIKRSIHYRSGKKDGAERIWNALGILVVEKEYQENKAVRETYWNGKGVMVEQWLYHAPGICSELKDVIKWDSNGQLRYEKIFRGEAFTYREFDEKGELCKSFEGIWDGVKERITKYILGQVTKAEAAIAYQIDLHVNSVFSDGKPSNTLI
ncbi:MAG: hypothetical protein CMO81_10040 [Waddliaceae bacterium]|nr:hypothetical protein [Waddliaceae bacterium]